MDPLTIGFGLLKFAPVAAKWLGGDDAEHAAKNVLAIAEKVTGKQGEKAEKAIAADPKLQLEFKQAICDNEQALDKLYLKDRKDARSRDVKLRQMGHRNIRADLMILVAALVLALDIYMLYANPEMPDAVIAIFNMIAGSVLTMLNSAFQFEFGSSRGSKEKDLK